MILYEKAGFLPEPFREDGEHKQLLFKNEETELRVEIPHLSEIQLEQLAQYVKQSQKDYLEKLSYQDIICVIDQVITKLLDRSHPIRQKAEHLLPIVTGYDEEIIRLGLTSYLKTFRAKELHRFVTEDFPNPLVLDRFQPGMKEGYQKVIGPNLLVHIWAGNVPALPLWSLISGLLVKAGSIGKVSSIEPLFAGWFVQLLVEIDPRLADCLAVVWWKGGDQERERILFQEAEVVAGYGTNDTLSSIKSRMPLQTRFLSFGHKMSFGMISRSALEGVNMKILAKGAALDVIRYDQQGCYSPHIFFVEHGGIRTAKEFAETLGAELSALAIRYPRRQLSMEEEVKWVASKHHHELESYSIQSKQVLQDKSGLWTVIYEQDHADFYPSQLNREIRVIGVSSLEEVVSVLYPHKHLLQTVGVAAGPERLFELADLLASAGVTRMTAIGSMTSPEAGWHHDGRCNLHDLVTFVDIESNVEKASEIYASYRD